MKKGFLGLSDIVKKNKLKLSVAAVIDILGFFAASIVYSYFFLKLYPHLVNLVDIIGAGLSKDLSNLGQSELMQLASKMGSINAEFEIVKTMAVYMIIALFSVWFVSQLLSWLYVKKSFGKVDWKRYVWHFSVVNVAAYALMFVITKVVFRVQLLSNLFGKEFGPKPVTGVLLGVLIIVLYIVSAFYVKCGEKSLMGGFKQMVSLSMLKYFFSSLALVVVFGVLLYYLVLGISLVSGVSIVLLSPIYVLMFPLFTCAKVLLHLK